MIYLLIWLVYLSWIGAVTYHVIDLWHTNPLFAACLLVFDMFLIVFVKPSSSLKDDFF